MAAKLVFPLTNNYAQGDDVGICTCAALHWAKAVLKLGRGLKTKHEIGIDEHAMNVQMAVVKKFDSNPVEQSERVGLECVGGADIVIASIDDVIRQTKAAKPSVCIFWTPEHTMGYSYSHNDKEFFDMNSGLYRAKTTKEIKIPMGNAIAGFGPIQGMRLLRLA